MTRSYVVTFSFLAFALACSGEKSTFNAGTPTVTTAPRTSDATSGVDELSSAKTPAEAAPPAPAPIAAPANAIKKGSFLVFTVPADPLPFKPYDIYITVDLSSAEDLGSYTKGDLSGTITGTDGFMYNLGSNIDGIESFSFNSDKVQAVLQVTIPGAVNNTKDSIKVNSTLLNESQVIELVF